MNFPANSGPFIAVTGHNLLIMKPSGDFICVDASCLQNPGITEWRGIRNREIIFSEKLDYATNNIGEFLALCMAMEYRFTEGLDIPIYSDSYIALNWVKTRSPKTTLPYTFENREVFEMLTHYTAKLADYSSSNIHHWKTKLWGEIPADYNRK